MAFLTNLAFISNLAGPDMILILLIVMLLFGAKNLPNLSQAVRELFGSEDEDELGIMRRSSVQPPQGAMHPLISRFVAPFLILIVLVALCLFMIWLNQGP